MRIGTPGFVPGRLTEARAARRILSMAALARQMGVSPSTVTRWEDGSITPDSDALTELANTLRVRREFFLRPIYKSTRPMFYRSLSSTLVKDLDYQHSQMSWLHEISAVLQHYVDLPPVDIPDVLGGASYKQLRDEDIERIALDLRRHWKIGEGACTDIVALLSASDASSARSKWAHRSWTACVAGPPMIGLIFCWQQTRCHFRAGKWMRPMKWLMQSFIGT